jgi:membrane-bound ClpP family serine protease
MTGLGIGLLLAGVVLLVAEAHTPAGGVLGALGLLATASGIVLAVEGAGGGVVLAVVLALVVTIIVAIALLAAVRAVARSRPRRIRSGREALIGCRGRARDALGAEDGHVFVEGALWLAHNADPSEPVAVGDPVIVERIDGLTLTVRRAEPWELDV